MIATEPGGAEGVGHRRVALAHQQRALQGQNHRLDQPPGLALGEAERHATQQYRAVGDRPAAGTTKNNNRLTLRGNADSSGPDSI